MANNQVATTATQEMLNINAQIAEYEEKMNNLEREANSVFKGDVPQYIANAYMNNKRQQYQSEINKLESRYNAALDLYKTELSNAQWKEEMNLKYLQYQQ
jgi:predicted transcriptional regulator